MADNIQWIKGAQENKLVVGSQARILYADAEGRMKIAKAFNDAIAAGKIGSVVLEEIIMMFLEQTPHTGRHPIFMTVHGTLQTWRFTNVIGDGFRGATWISIHNGGGVGWGEVINGGFGMLLDGSSDAERRLKMMLHWDVNNGISRRSWARNEAGNVCYQAGNGS